MHCPFKNVVKTKRGRTEVVLSRWLSTVVRNERCYIFKNQLAHLEIVLYLNRNILYFTNIIVILPELKKG